MYLPALAESRVIKARLTTDDYRIMVEAALVY